MDPAPKKPQFYLPKRPPDNYEKNDTEEVRGSYGERATATLGSIGTDQSPTITFPNSNVRDSSNYGNASTQAFEETLMRLQQQLQQQKQEAFADRDFPPGTQVIRGEDQGLATGMFCPLCFGGLFQFVVSERRGFVMCPSRQVASPYPVLLRF